MPAYERAGVSEVWLINADNRTVAIYRLTDGRYGPPTIQKMEGLTALSVAPEVVIDWGPIVAAIVAKYY